MKAPKKQSKPSEHERSEHTPPPWQLDSHYPHKGHTWNGHQVFEATADNFTQKQVAIANAAFIVRAVNSHDILIQALKTAFRYGRFEDPNQLKMIQDVLKIAEESNETY